MHSRADVFLRTRPTRLTQEDLACPHGVHPCWRLFNAAAHAHGRRHPLSVQDAGWRRAMANRRPDALHRRCRTLVCPAKTSTASPPPPCASAPVAAASSPRTASGAPGTPAPAGARPPPPVSPRSSGWRRAGRSARPPLPATTRAPCPPSRAEACGSRKPAPCRGPTAMARASRALSTAARGRKTATSPGPPSPSRGAAPPGKPLGPRPGSCPPPGGSTPTVLRRPRPGVAPGSRAPAARPHPVLGSPQRAWPSLPCGPPPAPPRLAAGGHPRLLQRSVGPPPRATTRRSFPRTPTGPAEADERLPALRHGLPPCPPGASACPPWRPRLWRVLPTAPPRTARPSGPAHRAQAARTATAARRATAVGPTTAASVPGVTGPGPRASRRHRTRGSSTPWTHRSRGRPASAPALALRPGGPGGVPRNAARTRPWCRRRHQPANGWPQTRVASGPLSLVAPGSCPPGAGRCRTLPPGTRSSLAGASPRTARPGVPPEPTSWSLAQPSPPLSRARCSCAMPASASARR
jgi:hypothetical protein